MILEEMILEDGKRHLLVHFQYQEPGEERWRIACAPEAEPLCACEGRNTPWHRSDDPRPVSCPFCKQTEAFVTAMARIQSLRRSR